MAQAAALLAAEALALVWRLAGPALPERLVAALGLLAALRWAFPSGLARARR